MKGRQVVLGRLFGLEAAALMQDGQLIDLLISSGPLSDLPPGAVCRAATDRFMKGQGGVFLRLPGGQTGYLRDRKGVSEGKPLLVQIAGVAEDGKALPLSTRLLFRGRHVLVTPEAPGINVSRRIRDEERRDELAAMGREVLADRSHGLILRSAAETADDEDISTELAELIELADRICAETTGAPELLLDAPSPWEQAWMDWADPAPDTVEEGDDSFARCGVLEAIDDLLQVQVDLPGGASAFIEPTRALVTVDVNTGSDSSLAAGLKANIALARDLPRQLALRGLGGQIVIDFAPMPKRDRVALDQVLGAAFRQAGAETTLVGWTAMGLFELNRKRDRVPLARLAAATEGA
ncbi:MAG: ribonuclease E/G [Paracoccus sp. (in: a-proteobacteria)]|uniref:ribonuclease E/G n=1 Tax=Paracoccus sp. TaxID=267 RepID=UPI002E8588C3|nr:ribonuclease E/G [Pseudomonadota bacterium]